MFLKALGGTGVAILLLAVLLFYLWWRKSHKGEVKDIFAMVAQPVKNFHAAVAAGFKGEAGYKDSTASIMATVITLLVVAVII